MKITPQTSRIINLFSEEKYIIPDFQRPFSWGSKQFNSLLVDIYDAFLKSKEKQDSSFSYFIGAIYISKKKKRFSILDGQQRITFFYLMFIIIKYNLEKLRYELIKKNNDFNQKPINDKISDIEKIIVFNKQLDPTRVKKEQRIISQGVDKNILESIVNWSIEEKDFINLKSSKKLIDNIFKNFIAKNEYDKTFLEKYKVAIDKIYSFLKNNFKNLEENKDFFPFIDFISKNIQFVELDFDETELNEVLDVFIKINNSGKHLDTIDLIKSQICKYYAIESLDDYEENFKKDWAYLLKKTITKKGLSLLQYIEFVYKTFVEYTPGSISEEDFLNWYKNDGWFLKILKNDKNKIQQIVQFLKDPIKMDAFKVLNNGFNYDKDDKDIDSKYKKIFNLYLTLCEKMEFETYKILLFRALYNYHFNKEKFPLINIVETIQIALRFSLCYQTISKSGAKFTKQAYLKVMKEIKEKEESLSNIEIYNKANLISIFEDKADNFKFNEIKKFKKEFDKRFLYIPPKSNGISKVFLTISEFQKNDKLKDMEQMKINILQLKLKQEGKMDLDHIIVQNPEQDNNKNNKDFEIIGKTDSKPKHIKILNPKWFQEFKDRDDKDNKIIQNDNTISFDNYKKFIVNNLGNHQLITSEENLSWSNKHKGFFDSYQELIERRKEIINNFFNSEIFND